MVEPAGIRGDADRTNAEIERWIRLSIRYGGDFQVRLEYRIVWDEENGRPVWKRVPVIRLDNGRIVRLSDRTVQGFAREEALGWYDTQREAIETLFALGATEALRENAELLDLAYSERWARDWLKRRSDLYRADEGLYRKYRSEKLKRLCVNDGYDRISGIITQGIRENRNPAEITREIREKVFGLSPGARSKSLTSRAEAIMRTELKYAKKLIVEDTIRKDTRILGVRIRFYGGPCPSNICVNILRTGWDFKREGVEAVADFWYDDGGVPLPPYHTRCHCTETRYLYAVDWFNRAERTFPDSVLPDKAPRPFEFEREMPEAA